MVLNSFTFFFFFSQGKVKAVPLNYSSVLDPMPNYDSHVAKSNAADMNRLTSLQTLAVYDATRVRQEFFVVIIFVFNPLWKTLLGMKGEAIDHIEYDVTIQKPALQHGSVSSCVGVCVHVHVPGIRRFFDVCIKMRIWFSLQDGYFHSNKWVFQYGL